MKILILYSTKNGTTAECAKMLCDKLSGSNEVTLTDIKAEGDHAPDAFDVVILGSSVRMGRISKKMKKYIKENLEMLNTKKCAAFLCCGFPDEFEEYVRSELPATLSLCYGAHCFGGELKPKKLRGLDRLIVGVMRRSIVEHDFEDGNYKGLLPEIIPEHISMLADKILGK